MIKRELLKYTWSYEDGIVTLTDNTSKQTFQFPIAYMDSFVRATLSFKIAHRNEQLKKLQDRINKKDEQLRQTKGQFTNFKLDVYRRRREAIAERRARKEKQHELK